MTTRSIKVYRDVQDAGSIEYGFVDQYDRQVGYKWRIHQVDYEKHDVTTSPCGYYLHEVGTVFELWGQPTRNGGGYQHGSLSEFATLEQARQAAVKRVEQARKRDTKKFARVPA